jgi:serine/threonine-protein kinase
LARFRKEARAVAAIQSEHVARVLDAGHLGDGTPFMALELLEGDDLEQVLQKRPWPLPTREVIDWILQALEGLAEVHALGMVHRDLKPANLFLARLRDGDSIVKILDFGISKQCGLDLLSQSASNLTATSTIVGSPMYMAPEQLRDAKRVDARADIWAIGAVLYELLAGRPPFWAENIAQLICAVLHDAPDSLRAVRPDVEPGLEAVVLRCLSRNAQARFADVAELADALVPFGPEGAVASALRTRHLVHTATERSRKPSRRFRVPRFLAFAVAALTLGAATAAGVALSDAARHGSGRLLERSAQSHVSR